MTSAAGPSFDITCARQQERMFEFVLHVLDADEERELRTHLDSPCPRCAAVLAEAQVLIARELEAASTPTTPTPATRERLLRRIESAAPSTAPTQAAAPPAAPVHRFRFRPLWAAALAAGIVLAASLWSLTQIRERYERSAAQTSHTIAVLEHELDAARRRVAILSARDLKVVKLAANEDQHPAWGRIFWDTQRGVWEFYVCDLLPPASGRTYELWFITKSEQKIPAGTFDVTPTGEAFVTVTVPANLSDLALAAITDEPAGGVAQPTGSIHLVGALQ